MEETKEKNVKVRLSRQLYSDVTKILGSRNYSDIVRKALEIEVEKRKETNKKYLYCFCCDKLQEKKSDMNVLIWGRNEEGALIVFVCDSCLNEIAKIKNYEKILKNPSDKHEGRKSFLHFVLREEGEGDFEEAIATVRQEKDNDIPMLDLYDKLISLYPGRYSCQFGRFQISEEAIPCFEKDMENCYKILAEGILSKEK